MKKYVACSMLVAGMLIGCGGGSSGDKKANVSSSSQNAQNTSSNGTSENTNFKFTKEWLEKTTVYSVSESEECKESGGTQCFFVGVVTFKNNELYGYKYSKPEYNITTSYILNEEKGYLKVKNRNNEIRYINATGAKTADYIPINWGENLNKYPSDYWYFDLEKAKARAKAENSK